MPTDAGYRDGILKNAKKASIALRYKDLIKKRAERTALVRGMDVIYIYHDRIDEAGHTDEETVFEACEETIAELKNMIRSKAGILASREISGRCSFRFLRADGLCPYQEKGRGLNFVHGGISLQEMVVPVIDYHYMRTDSVGYKRNKDKFDTRPVTVQLLSANRKIGNMIFSLNFYQKEAVGDNREAVGYLLYFVDSENRKVSDTQKIIADRTSEVIQERTFRVSFNLRSMKYDNKESYYLVIADESGTQLPVREEFTIDIAFAVDDFDFFH